MERRKIRIFFVAALLPLMPAAGQEGNGLRMGIKELFDMVGTANRSVLASRVAVEESRESLGAASAGRLPDVSVELAGSYNGNGAVWNRDFTNYHKAYIPHWGNSFALQARQLVYRGGAQSAVIAMAETRLKMAENNSEAAFQQAAFVAVGLYLDLCQRDNSIRVYERNIALTERLIDNVRAKYAQGTALKNDITRHELLLDEQKLQLRRLRDSRDVANSRLCAVLNMAQQTIWPDTAVAAMAFPAGGVEAWLASAENSSTRIRGGNLQIDLARSELKSARSRLLPKLSVVAEDHLTGPVTIEIPALNNNFNYWFVGVGLSYELSSLFKARADVRRSKAALRRLQVSLDDTRSLVGEDTREAFTLFLQAEAELSVRQKSVELARENYQVVSSRYLSDLAIVTDMTDAENLLLQSELDLENARIAVVFAFYRLRYQTGTLRCPIPNENEAPMSITPCR